jgi:diguanylate cyclase (GGDEF)-like protein
MIESAEDARTSIKIRNLQQRERVRFLYERFPAGMVLTLIVAGAVLLLASFELSLQTRDLWVYGWVGGLVLIQVLRYRMKTAFDHSELDEHGAPHVWQKRFAIGVCAVAVWQGGGAMLVMPYISDYLRLILHVFLLGLGAGAIAFLATSMRIYGCYLLLMIMPVTLFLFIEGRPEGLVLGGMYLFMLVGYWFGVRRMNQMICDALSLRFENELLVADLQRLLAAVAESNKELDRLATTDEMTGAANYRAFRVGLENLYRKHASAQAPIALVLINIDHFYEYNLYYGQDIGNRTITRIAHLLMSEIIQNDQVVARVNGAEFAVILPYATGSAAQILLENVCDKLHAMKIEHSRSSTSDVVTLSVGIYCASASESVTSRDMILHAEQALRQAKKKGRNRIELMEA